MQRRACCVQVEVCIGCRLRSRGRLQPRGCARSSSSLPRAAAAASAAPPPRLLTSPLHLARPRPTRWRRWRRCPTCPTSSACATRLWRSAAACLRACRASRTCRWAGGAGRRVGAWQGGVHASQACKWVLPLLLLLHWRMQQALPPSHSAPTCPRATSYSLPLPPAPQPAPSHSNFVLCRVAEGRDAKALKDTLAKEHGIMVRHYRWAWVLAARAACTWRRQQSAGRPTLGLERAQLLEAGGTGCCARELHADGWGTHPPAPAAAPVLPFFLDPYSPCPALHCPARPPQHQGAQQLHPHQRGPAGAHGQAAGRAARAGIGRHGMPRCTALRCAATAADPPARP